MTLRTHWFQHHSNHAIEPTVTNGITRENLLVGVASVGIVQMAGFHLRQKDQILFSEEPLLSLQTTQTRAFALCCSHCGNYLMDWKMQV
jgi:hypothetical protein